MTYLVNLTAISGDKQFSLNWDHVVLGVGDTTKFSIVTITNKTVGNSISSHKLTYYNNPLTGTFLLDNLVVGTEYLVAVVQYTSLGLMYASTPIPLSVSSSPDAVELHQGDINTVNDLTSITIQTHFPTNYSNGGSLLTKIQFTVASEDLFYNYLFDKASDDLYILSNLAPNQSYEIAASAMNSIGISDLSNTIFEITSGYPTSPATFNITTSYSISNDETKVLLAWTPPTNANLTDLLGYVIKYKLASETIYAERDVNGRTLVDGTVDVTADGTLIQNMSCEFLNEFTTDSQTYDFKIVPYNSLDISLQTYSTAVLQAYIFKNALSVQTATSVPGDSLLQLAWVAPSSLRGYALENYYIKVYTGDSATGPFNSFYTNLTEYTIPGLTNGQNMCVVILAQTKNTVTNEIIDGASTTIVSTTLNHMTTTPYKLASLVNNLVAVPTDRLVSLSWSHPSYDGGFAIDSYIVENNNSVPTFSVTGITTTTDIVVPNGVDIIFTITPVTRNGELFGAPNTVPSRAYTKPNPIPSLQVIPIDSSIKLVFAPSDYDGGYAILNYKISYKKSVDMVYHEDFKTVAQLTSIGSDFVYVFSAENGVGYDIKIEVINSVPNTENNISTYVISENHIPYRTSSPVTQLDVTASNTQLYASWEPPSNPGGFAIVNYEIYLDDNIVETVVYTTTNKLFSGLTNGQYYKITIVPLTFPDYISPLPLPGESLIAPDIKPYTNPDPVNNLAAAEKDKEIFLSWTAPSTTGGNIIVGYSVMMLDASGFTMLDHTINDASILNYTFNNANVNVNGRLIVNGDTYTLKCKVITKTDSNDLLYSSYQSIPAKPYGLPYNISYTINTNTNEIVIEVNNNGNHLSGVLICAPPSVDASIGAIASILVTSSITDPIYNTSNPLIDTYSHVMNYQLDIFTQQPMLIVATNSAGMSYTQNFAGIEQVTPLM